MKKLVWLALVVLILVSCAPDPRSQADADVARAQAEQNAADQAQAREQDAQRFALEQRQREAVSIQWVESWSGFIWWSMATLNLVVVVTLLALAIGTAISLVGIGRAVSNAAWVRSNLISVDVASGQYPMTICRVGHGIYTLTDMNTGQVRQLNVRADGDRQMIAAAFAGRMNTALAYQARMAGKNAADVALVGTNPVVVIGGSDVRE